MSDIQKFEYEGHPITFEFTDGVRMVNATQMARPFKKKVHDFLRLKGTKEYMEGLVARYGNSLNVDSQILRIVQGGLDTSIQGTWMHEKLALKFAAWLSVPFEIWVFDCIEILVKEGEVKLQDPRLSVRNTDLRGMPAALRLLADHIEEQTRINEEVKDQLDYHAEMLGEIQAHLVSIDENYYSISGYCALIGIPCPNDKALAWGRMASKLSRERGTDIGKVYDPKFGKVNSYHRSILEEIFKE